MTFQVRVLTGLAGSSHISDGEAFASEKLTSENRATGQYLNSSETRAASSPILLPHMPSPPTGPAVGQEASA